MHSRLPSKEVWIGWISSMFEAYNMAIYSFTAPLLAMWVFQNVSENQAVFFSYALIFFGGCFLYPLGAFYYGFIGDKEGRQKTCVYSTLGLAIATGLMGVVPYHVDYSWICFLALIAIQHFFSGGEYYGSIVFSMEHSDQKQTGLMSAFSCLFAVFGIIIANGLAALSSEKAIEFMIRLCFLTGGIGGVISFILKNHCSETPAFMAIKEDLSGDSWREFFRLEWLTIACVVLVFAFYMVSYSFIFIFLPLLSFESSSGQYFDTFQSLIAYACFLVIGGKLADCIGVERAMKLGALCFSLLIVPLVYWAQDLFYIQLLLTACVSLTIGPIHGWILHQFKISHRCRGVFISSAFAISIFYGSTVPLCLLIYENFHSLIICSLYPLCFALICIGALTYLNIRNTVPHEIRAIRD